MTRITELFDEDIDDDTDDWVSTKFDHAHMETAEVYTEVVCERLKSVVLL